MPVCAPTLTYREDRSRATFRCTGCIGLALLFLSLRSYAQSAPLAEVDRPTPETASATLWCPDCLKKPILIEAHLTALGIRRTTSSGAKSDDVADLDLIVRRPVPSGTKSGDGCGPQQRVLSNEATPDCYADKGIAASEISTDSMGWFDVIDVPQGGYFERESFYAAPSRTALERVPPSEQSWCLTTYGQQAEGATAYAVAQLEIVLDGARRYLCTTNLNTGKGGSDHRLLKLVKLQGCSSGLAENGRAASLEIRLNRGVACLREQKPWQCRHDAQFKEPDECSSLPSR